MCPPRTMMGEPVQNFAQVCQPPALHIPTPLSFCPYWMNMHRYAEGFPTHTQSQVSTWLVTNPYTNCCWYQIPIGPGAKLLDDTLGTCPPTQPQPNCLFIMMPGKLKEGQTGVLSSAPALFPSLFSCLDGQLGKLSSGFHPVKLLASLMLLDP